MYYVEVCDGDFVEIHKFKTREAAEKFLHGANMAGLETSPIWSE